MSGDEPYDSQSLAWRTIDSAPAYRVPVLLIGRYPKKAGWSDVYHCWRGPGGSNWVRWPHDFPPTHWVPVTEPQEEESNGSSKNLAEREGK